MKPSLDVVIVNWNTKGALAACLHSMEVSHRAEVDLQRVVVVDNHSTDHSLSGLNIIMLPLEIIGNVSNRGFAAACNQGAKNSKADYLLFLNPDTTLTDKGLQAPVQFMERPENHAVGVCGLRLLDDEGRPSISSAQFPTPSSMWIEGIGLHRLAPNRFEKHYESNPGAETKKVDQVIGAYFLVRRKIFNDLSGFDERFFVYFEEVDISLRLAQLGYKSFILGNVWINHTGCGSSDQVKDKRLFYFWRSRLHYARKHFSVLQYCGIILLTFVAEPLLRLLRAALARSGNSIVETVRAYGYLSRQILLGEGHEHSR